MRQYMLLCYKPTDTAMEPADHDAERDRWTTFDRAVKDAGIYRSNHGLGDPEVATTVQVRDDETQIIDGPFAETKEYFAGFYLIAVPDLDAALKWAARMPVSRYGSVEVRPVWGQ